jgi:transposase InsO family protein
MARELTQQINKSALAKELGISRSSLYYQPIRPKLDEDLKSQIESVMGDHPDYGHKRIAIHLKMNKKRVSRVMKKYGLKPYRRRGQSGVKRDDLGNPPAKYQNLISDLISNLSINRPSQVWAADFTFLRFHEKFIYLATVIDLYSREITGVNLSRFHNRFLVVGAFLDAADKYPLPEIIHSDQGSEYNSREFTHLMDRYRIKVSMSHKGSPWENGYQESFFGHFKRYCGDLNRFETIGELLEEIYHSVHYYNHDRIHSKLKMPPKEFRMRFYQQTINKPLSKKRGT